MHALHLGHPVMGDSLYGTEEGKAKSDRLLLHARKISFPHVRHKTSNTLVVRFSSELDQATHTLWQMPPLRVTLASKILVLTQKFSARKAPRY